MRADFTVFIGIKVVEGETKGLRRSNHGGSRGRKGRGGKEEEAGKEGGRVAVFGDGGEKAGGRRGHGEGGAATRDAIGGRKERSYSINKA